MIKKMCDVCGSEAIWDNKIRGEITTMVGPSTMEARVTLHNSFSNHPFLCVKCALAFFRRALIAGHRILPYVGDPEVGDEIAG